MAAPTITITSTLPVCETRAIETMWIYRCLELVAGTVRRGGGTVTSGTITDGSLSLCSFTYVPGAAS